MSTFLALLPLILADTFLSLCSCAALRDLLTESRDIRERKRYARWFFWLLIPGTFFPTLAGLIVFLLGSGAIKALGDVCNWEHPE